MQGTEAENWLCLWKSKGDIWGGKPNWEMSEFMATNICSFKELQLVLYVCVPGGGVGEVFFVVFFVVVLLFLFLFCVYFLPKDFLFPGDCDCHCHVEDIACMSWMISPDRLHLFIFSQTKKQASSVYDNVPSSPIHYIQSRGQTHFHWLQCVVMCPPPPLPSLLHQLSSSTPGKLS